MYVCHAQYTEPTGHHLTVELYDSGVSFDQHFKPSSVELCLFSDLQLQTCSVSVHDQAAVGGDT